MFKLKLRYARKTQRPGRLADILAKSPSMLKSVREKAEKINGHSIRKGMKLSVPEGITSSPFIDLPFPPFLVGYMNPKTRNQHMKDVRSTWKAAKLVNSQRLVSLNRMSQQ